MVLWYNGRFKSKYICLFRMFVEQRPFGFGIQAHRGIKAICERAGIKDLYCKVGVRIFSYSNNLYLRAIESQGFFLTFCWVGEGEK